MVHQIIQEGAVLPSVMITLGPAWRKVRNNNANISSTIECWQAESVHQY